ncbi:MAG: SGNH/GDSL hydrolase family protein [Solirubrobacterales bacterium]|nr:SGNH/GDSL hydrolase family protein [Solirubrobacterales bacterium]
MPCSGDSISAGTGTSGLPSAEQPANSWGTGTNGAVQSVYTRLLAINPAISGNRYPMAANGKKMTDMAGQATSMPATTELVLVEMGGNDLCKDSVAAMTSLTDYRSQFVAGLNAIAARSPNALISVSSIPDIFNLWFLRGAPNPPNSQPSSRAGTARFFWDTLSVIPCQSLVADPTDMSAAAVARREAVRERDIAFNQILAEECALRLRCRFDDNALFNFSSNRVDPLSNGPYLPREQWQFVDDDISTIDHFHPSLSGQTKVAQKAWESGFQYSDSTAPTVSTQTVVPQLANGASLTAPTVTVGYSDAAGIKGIEYRLRTGAAAGSWQTLMSNSVSVPVNSLGVSWVETRAQDRNGNLTASSMTEVNYDPNAIPAPEITGPLRG